MNNWQIIGRVAKVEPRQLKTRTVHRLTITAEIEGETKPAAVVFDWWHDHFPPVGQEVVASGTFSSWENKDGAVFSSLVCTALWPLFSPHHGEQAEPVRKPEPRRVADAHVPTTERNSDIPF